MEGSGGSVVPPGGSRARGLWAEGSATGDTGPLLWAPRQPPAGSLALGTLSTSRGPSNLCAILSVSPSLLVTGFGAHPHPGPPCLRSLSASPETLSPLRSHSRCPVVGPDVYFRATVLSVATADLGGAECSRLGVSPEGDQETRLGVLSCVAWVTVAAWPVYREPGALLSLIL